MAVESVRWDSALEWRRIVGSPYCDLKPTAKHVVVTLSYYGDKWGDNIFPSTRELARRTCISRKTVMKCLRRAMELGWLYYVETCAGPRGRQGYKRRYYTLTVPTSIDALRLEKKQFWQPPWI